MSKPASILLRDTRFKLAPTVGLLPKGMQSCFLHCVNKSHDAIELPHLIPVTVGRSLLTKITDRQCSRRHAELTADFKRGLVTFKQLGTNPCVIEGKQLSKNEDHILQDAQSVCLLPGKYKHYVAFRRSNAEQPDSQLGNSGGRSKETSEKGQLKDRERDSLVRDKPRESNNLSRYFTNHSAASKRSLEFNGEEPAKKPKMEEENVDEESVEDKLKYLKEKYAMQEKKEPGSGATRTEIINTPSTAGDLRGSPATESSWKTLGQLLVYTSKDLQSSSKIASFDIDGTIITTKSGKVFPRDSDDWRIYLPEVPRKLKTFHKEGYKIVFFTNQLGIAKGKLDANQFRKKVENIISKLGIPVQVFVATSFGLYRKPISGMWEYLKEHQNGGIDPDLASSFYVGDAAGRPANWAAKKKKDHSCSDRLFAINVGLDFYTPEEFFLGQRKAQYEMPKFDPKTLNSNSPLLSPSTAKMCAGIQEIVIFVGLPAAGKSTFYKAHFLPLGYRHVNRDKLGTWQKCVSACEAALGQGQSVVIDNTNLEPESRGRYIECAKKANVQCRCFWFAATPDMANHNETFRKIVGSAEEKPPVNVMVMNSCLKKFQEPRLDEGFAEIVTVNFVPHFKNISDENIYRQFLVA